MRSKRPVVSVNKSGTHENRRGVALTRDAAGGSGDSPSTSGLMRKRPIGPLSRRFVSRKARKGWRFVSQQASQRRLRHDGPRSQILRHSLARGNARHSAPRAILPAHVWAPSVGSTRGTGPGVGAYRSLVQRQRTTLRFGAPPRSPQLRAKLSATPGRGTGRASALLSTRRTPFRPRELGSLA